MKDEAAEATVSAIASKFTYGGSSAAVVFGLTANELAAVLGVLIALAGLAVQWYYKRKSNHREQILHDARMAGLIIRDEDV